MTAKKEQEEAEDARESTNSGTTEAGPVVTEVMVTPLKEALRALLVEHLSADAVEGALVHLLARLRIGVKQLRPSRQLAPWMAKVVAKVAGPSTPTTSEARIATALLPFLDLLPPEHAEVLRLTDHGPLTQRAASARLGIPLIPLKSRVSAARRHLRRVVLAGLHLLAPVTPDTTPPEPSPDTHPRRHRLPPSALLAAFTTALEDLVRPWVPAEHTPATARALLTHLHTALTTRRRQTRLGPWLHAILHTTLLSGPWSSTLLSHPPPTPSPADLSALAAALTPLLAALSPEQSTALQLFDLSTRSLHAAAHEAGTDRPTFQNRLQRARLHLTRILIDLTLVQIPPSRLTACASQPSRPQPRSRVVSRQVVYEGL